MFGQLLPIIDEVNQAPDLESALSTIVSRVKDAVGADVCSVYLTETETRAHVLQATDGLRADAVRHVRMDSGRGLVGWVCERAETLNLADASDHPRYLRMSDTGELLYRGFLGVPIIQNGQVLGVLVLRQREERRFDDHEVAFATTLAAQLAGAIALAEANGDLARLDPAGAPGSCFLRGLAASPGIGMGEAVVGYQASGLSAVPDRPVRDVDQDLAAFRAAVAALIQEIEGLEARIGDRLEDCDRALFDAWRLMLQSDTLIEGTEARIRAGNWAQGALRETIEDHARVFESMQDDYLRERGADVRDLGQRILARLENLEMRPLSYPEQTVLVGDELSAMQIAEVPQGRLAGIVSTKGSSSSHVAILARGMGVPAAMGATGLPAVRLQGRQVIVDGYRGRVHVSPTESVLTEYRRFAAEDKALSGELEALRGLPAETSDGYSMPLNLNTGLVSELRPLGIDESDGVGLYRTELPFLVRNAFPTEQEQIKNYRRVLQTFSPRSVTLRTLDIGGDKALPYFPVVESNPFLGWRGIRISLDHPEIFLVQVRAMMVAARGLENLQVLLPMVSTVDEVDDAMSLIQRAHDELVEEGVDVRMPPVGVMVEVPAAIYQIESLARRVNFISVGTNDLTQYLLAVDRNNAHVAPLFDELHPAVLRALVDIAKGARIHGREVSICGEMAGDPLAAPLLLGMGVHSLSMGAHSLLRIKWVIRRFSRAKARELLGKALRLESGEHVRSLMVRALEDVGLGRLVRSRS